MRGSLYGVGRANPRKLGVRVVRDKEDGGAADIAEDITPLLADGAVMGEGPEGVTITADGIAMEEEPEEVAVTEARFS